MLSQIIAFLSSSWQPIVVAILAVDAALIPLFPNAGILGKIKEVLSGLAPKA